MQFQFEGVPNFPGFDIPFVGHETRSSGGPFPFGGTSTPFDERFQSANSNTELYDKLKVAKSADSREIKQAHRKLALLNHPDKGGDVEKFKEINNAYEILKDPEKRQIYDKYGEDAVKNGSQSSSFSNPFEAMFPGHHPFARHASKPSAKKSEPIIEDLGIRLEEMYSGVTKKLAVTRKLACDSCNGSGSKSGRILQCDQCDGKGMKTVTIKMGPGMIGQTTSPCEQCNQTGNLPANKIKDACQECQGQGLRSKKKLLEIYISPGSIDGDKIVMSGEAGKETKSDLPGDLIFILKEKKHEMFKRVKQDLVMAYEMSLADALLGAPIVWRHLDGRILKYKPKANRPLKPDQSLKIKNEGMPSQKERFDKGNLVIKFKIRFPDSLDESTQRDLANILFYVPKSKNLPDIDGQGSHLLKGINFSDVEDIERDNATLINTDTFGETETVKNNEDNSADDEPSFDTRHGVQCAQQ